MHSIRVKITAITIIAILISIVTLGVLGVYTVSAESDQNSAHEMNLIADDEKKSLDAHLISLEQSVSMVAHIAGDMLDNNSSVVNKDTLLGNCTPEQAEQCRAYLARHGETIREAYSSVANHTSGVVTYYYCMNPEVAPPEFGFFYSKVGTKDFEKQEPLDAKTLDPNDIEHYTWYFTPIERGKACWLGPYLAHFLNEAWTVSYVTPIYQDGVLLGVLGMDILLDTMIDQIKDIQIYDTGFVCLLDGEGRILHHPDYETGSYPEEASDMLSMDMFQQPSSAGKLLRYNAHGEERQLAFSTLANGMKLVAVAPVREITESQRHLTQIIVFVAVILLAFFTIFTPLFMRVVTRPLQRLTAASQRLADGDYDVELDYEGKDEVGVLTDAFRRMRDHLKLYIGDLNSRASTDALTGVKNKSAFDADALHLNEGIARGWPEDMPMFAIAMFDCNRLKVINDEHGHDRGDLYLRRACQTICDTFAHSPVYRLGGDEFAVLLEHGDYLRREELVETFREQADKANAAATAPWERVDLAMGVAEFDPTSDESVEQVLHRADELMYLDKRLYKLSLK